MKANLTEHMKHKQNTSVYQIYENNERTVKQSQLSQVRGTVENAKNNQLLPPDIPKDINNTKQIKASDHRYVDSKGDNLAVRLLRVLIIATCYFVLELVVKALTIMQFIFVAWKKRPHTGMQRLGAMISEYMQALWKYCTFASDEAPWPFTPWPRNNDSIQN